MSFRIRGVPAVWVPCEALERCGAETKVPRHQGDANPTVSVADELGLGVTPIASAEQDTHAAGIPVTYVHPGVISFPEKMGKLKKIKLLTSNYIYYIISFRQQRAFVLVVGVIAFVMMSRYVGILLRLVDHTLLYDLFLCLIAERAKYEEKRINTINDSLDKRRKDNYCNGIMSSQLQKYDGFVEQL